MHILHPQRERLSKRPVANQTLDVSMAAGQVS